MGMNIPWHEPRPKFIANGGAVNSLTLRHVESISFRPPSRALRFSKSSPNPMLLKFRKTTKSLCKDWSLCTILILENKILEDTRGDKKKRFVPSFFSSSSRNCIVQNVFWNYIGTIKIDRLRSIVGKIQRSKNCWKSKNFSPSLRLKSNPWKVFGQHSRTAAECRSCRLTNGRGNGILKAGLQQMFEPGTGKKAAREFRGFDKSAVCVSTVYAPFVNTAIVPIVALPCPRTNCEIYSLSPSPNAEKLGGVGFRERDEIERYALLFLLFFLLFFFFFLFSFLRALA